MIVFGGTFDPLHDGHDMCVVSALTLFPAARLLLCPTVAPLLDATTTPKTPLLSFTKRCQLLEKHFCAHPRIFLSTVEELLPRPNLTVNLLQRLRALYPRQRLGFLLGQDQYATFATWQGARAMLLAGCDLLVAARNGFEEIAVCTQALAKKLSLPLVRKSEKLFQHQCFSVYCLQNELVDITSTEIRLAYQQKRALPRVPSAVREFFQQEQEGEAWQTNS